MHNYNFGVIEKSKNVVLKATGKNGEIYTNLNLADLTH